MKPNGFTLIELIIVSAIFASVGLMASTAFFNIMRGAVKSEIVKEVKQNGNYALSTMERMIRNSADVTSPCDGSAQTSLTILTFEGDPVTFSCTFADSAAQIASTSAVATGYLTNSQVSLGQSCPGTLQFRCTDSVSSPKIVTITFTLRQKSLEVPKSEQAVSNFQSTISLRNE